MKSERNEESEGSQPDVFLIAPTETSQPWSRMTRMTRTNPTFQWKTETASLLPLLKRRLKISALPPPILSDWRKPSNGTALLSTKRRPDLSLRKKYRLISESSVQYSPRSLSTLSRTRNHGTTQSSLSPEKSQQVARCI